MDIWEWVYERENALREQGEHRVAEFIDEIPSCTVNDEHRKVDALYPEALSLVRKMGDKWLEVYFRHWYLQSQVLTRRNGAGMLKEAVDLLEFAHREETRDCPQSVCAVQDLANCYAIIDGPGYVAERLAVARETLDRIDASWPCFTCINGEYNHALVDAGDYEQVLAALGEQKRALLAHNRSAEDSSLVFSELDALLGLRRFEEAERLARRARNDGGGNHFERKRRNYLALCLAHLSRAEEALEAGLSYQEALISPSFFKVWIQVRKLLIEQGAVANTEDLDLQFNTMIAILLNNKALRDVIRLAHLQAELAVKRGALVIAGLCARRIERIIPELHRDCGARANWEALESAIRQAAANRGKSSLGSIEQYLAIETESREEALELAHEAYGKWPDDERTALDYVQLLDASGWGEEALVIVREKFSFERSGLLMTYGNILIDRGKADEFLRIFGPSIDPRLDDELYCGICWLKMRFYRNSDPQQAYRHLNVLLERSPQARNALFAAAQLALTLRYHDEAIQFWTRLIELEPDQTNHHWDRMIPATISGDWTCVRESAQAVGLTIPAGEGPIEIQGGYIRLRFVEDNGDTRDYLALRTGPVTARVVGLERLGEPQRFGATVVFDAGALNSLDQEDEEGRPCDSEGYYTLLFPAVEVVDAPGYRYFSIDGVYPGDELLKGLKEELAGLGAFYEIKNGEDYVVYLEETDEEFPGIYAYLVVPETADLNILNSILDKFSAQAPYPLIWPDLLEALGDTEALKAQLIVQEKYGL